MIEQQQVFPHKDNFHNSISEYNHNHGCLITDGSIKPEEKQNMARKEINPEIWTYENDGDCIEGIYIGKEPNVGPNNSWMYHLETPEGGINVWGSTILDARMKFVKVGQKVYITYKGLGEKAPGKNAPKIFKVEIDED